MIDINNLKTIPISEIPPIQRGKWQKIFDKIPPKEALVLPLKDGYGAYNHIRLAHLKGNLTNLEYRKLKDQAFIINHGDSKNAT